MKKSRGRPFRIAKKFSQILVLQNDIDIALSTAMRHLNETMESERSSIFIFQPWNQTLTVYSSLDLKKSEISIPKDAGVAGWVFRKRKPAIVNDTNKDNRFYRGFDERTGFTTQKIICAPLILDKKQCIGTLQSMNKKKGGFKRVDLETIELAAHMLAIAISNWNHYIEIKNTNTAQRKIIEKFVDADIQLNKESSHLKIGKGPYPSI